METTAARDAREQFACDTAGFEMRILHDQGLYRHLRFKHPGHSYYWFDLVTWPGVLAINADMGAWTFSRVEDMLAWFRGKHINPGYWAEKIRAGENPREYSEAKFRQRVWEYFGECVYWGTLPRGHGGTGPGVADIIREEITGGDQAPTEDAARQLLDEFEYRSPLDLADARAEGTEPPEPWRFADTWEWDLTDWSYRYLWCCHAVRWGAEQYYAARRPVKALADRRAA